MNETDRLIYAYFDAFNRGDEEGLLGLLADDVIHEINEGPREIGIDSFRAFRSRMKACYREMVKDLVVMVNGTHGAAEFRCIGDYILTDGDLPEATGQHYEIFASAFFVVKGGKIKRVTSYYNLKGWIEVIS